MLQKLTITRIDVRDVAGKKDPTKTYKKVGIQTQERGEAWLSCFVDKFNEKALQRLAVGQNLYLSVEENGNFLNFKVPNQTDFLKERVALIEAKMGMTNPFAPFAQKPAALQNANDGWGGSTSAPVEKGPVEGYEKWGGAPGPDPSDIPF